MKKKNKEVIFYRGKLIDEMTKKELIEVVKTLWFIRDKSKFFEGEIIFNANKKETI